MFQKYKNAEDFMNMNDVDFKEIQSAKTNFLSLSQLMETGNALGESERLSFVFLNLAHKVTDLRLGLTSSLLDAQGNVKTVEGLLFRSVDAKSAAEKNKIIPAMQDYVDASSKANDLKDISEYLNNKHADFMSAHVYYKNISSRK